MSDGGDKIIYNVAELGGGEPGRRALPSASKPRGPARGASQGSRLALGITAPEKGRSHSPDPGPCPTQLFRAVHVSAEGDGDRRVRVAAAIRPDTRACSGFANSGLKVNQAR